MIKCPHQGTGILFPKPLAFSSWSFIYLGVTFCSLCVPVLTENPLSAVCREWGCFMGIYCQALGLCMSGCGHPLCVRTWAAVWTCTL